MNSPLMLILCFTGLRLGEVLALQWSDIDLEKNILSVTKTYSEQIQFYEEGNNLHKKAYIVTSPKRKSSIRKVVLCDAAVLGLKDLKRRY